MDSASIMTGKRGSAPASVPVAGHSEPAADWPNRKHSRILTHAGMRWHLQICGSGPTLLLLHGTAASTHSFTGLLPLLSRHFQVLSMDLPGHAYTRASTDYDYSMSTMATSISGLLCRLALSPQISVGHSAGAAILCRMALQQQLDSRLLVAINGALQGFAGLPGQLFGPLARLLAGSSLLPQMIARRARDQRAVQRLLRGTGSVPGAPYAELYQRLFQDPAHVAAVLKMMANWNLHELEPVLPQLPGRLHLLVADNDRAVPPSQAQALQRRLQPATVAVSMQRLSGVGHLAHEEQPQRVADLIVEQAQAAGLL